MSASVFLLIVTFDLYTRKIAEQMRSFCKCKYICKKTSYALCQLCD